MPQAVNRDQVQELLKHGARLVDVLPSKQYQRTHIAGAINFPLGKLDRASTELQKDQPVIVYCYDYQ